MNRERLASIRDMVRKTYTEPDVVSRYAHIGLWSAEEVLVLEYFPDNAQVLDLGCGAGRTTIPLAEMGLKVVGIDFSPSMIQLAQELAEVSNVEPDLQVMDAMDLKFADSNFDIALFSYNGLELLPGVEGKKKGLARNSPSAQTRRIVRFLCSFSLCAEPVRFCAFYHIYKICAR